MQRCHTCAHSLVQPEGEQKDLRVCHLNPPTVFGIRIHSFRGFDVEVLTMYPAVTHNDFCSKYEKDIFVALT